MTTLLAEPGADNIWASMPGWGIVADLTPPELSAARNLHVLRKRLGISLVIVLVLCVVGYVSASRQSSAANRELAASQATTSTLNAQNSKFSNVVDLQSSTDSIVNQVSTLMATDVDVATFIEKVQSAAPAGTAFTSVAVTLSGGSSGGTAGIAGTEPVIGTLTLSGTSNRMVDVATYVTALQGLTGVVNVIPSTNSASKAGGRATWAITAQISDQLYSHRFKAAPASSSGAVGGH